MEALQEFAPELSASDILPRTRLAQPKWSDPAAAEAWGQLAGLISADATFVAVADDLLVMPPEWRDRVGGVVICTGAASYDRAHDVWPFGDICRSLPVTTQGILLARLLVELQASQVAIGESAVGLAALGQVAGALGFAGEVKVLLPPTGKQTSGINHFLSLPFPSSLIFVAESRNTLAYWQGRFGLDEEQCGLLDATRSAHHRRG